MTLVGKIFAFLVLVGCSSAWKITQTRGLKKVFAAASIALSIGSPIVVLAEEIAEATPAAVPEATTPAEKIEKVPLFNKKSGATTAYNDIGRGFKLLRPFGFNEFQGEGGGYLVKFASLYDVDENVVIGSVPASAGKTSITEYGSLDSIGKKLATKRGGELISSKARETDGFIFYEFEFQNPIDKTLPRPGSRDATKIVELYELTVAKGRLWSVQATSNDKLFKRDEEALRASIASFVPRL